MNSDLEKAKRFDEIVGKPIMTAQQKIEQMKREREAKKAQDNTTPSQEIEMAVQTQDDKNIEDSKKSDVIPTLKKKKISMPALTFEGLLHHFRPMEIDVPRIHRSIHIREDAIEMEKRLLKILGGAGSKHHIGKQWFYVSASAFYTHLLLSFFEVHKEEIEQLEKQLLNH